MSTSFKGIFASRVDIGKVRISNDDQAAVLTNSDGDVFLVVCDGMGGHKKGDCASKIAIDYLVESFQKKRKTPWFFSRNWLVRTIRQANTLVFNEAEHNPAYKGMGTTCVAVLIQKNRLIIANVGDSRAYAFSNFSLQRLTEDQTYVDYLYRTGKITAEDTSSRADRHVLMNALGIYPSASMDVMVRPYSGEAILLCSDGLYNNVSEAEIRAILATNERADEKVNSLIAEANGNGGSDNIAVSYWEAI